MKTLILTLFVAITSQLLSQKEITQIKPLRINTAVKDTLSKRPLPNCHLPNQDTLQLIWYTNIDSAINLGISQNKPLLLLFTGSDWCGWCIRLQKEVFSQDEFKKWALENVILVEIDFPRNKPQSEQLKLQNALLQQQFNIMGYPTVHFVIPQEADNKRDLINLGRTGYVSGAVVNWVKRSKSIYTTLYTKVMNEFILETFSDLINKYDIKVNFKTKRTFQLFIMENIPFSEKQVIRNKVELITHKMGRKTFIVDNPTVKTVADETIITSGIWNIRIY